MLAPQGGDADLTAVLVAMATPAALLIAGAMLILSTNQRLQAVLHRIQENEDTLQGGAGDEAGAVLAELEAHGRRARLAHRALLALYAAAAALLIMILSLGSSTLGLNAARGVAVAGAFAGAGLLLLGACLLAAETWIGVSTIDRRVRRLLSQHRRP